MSVTAFTVFLSPLYGYNFSPSEQGLTSLSVLVGSLIAMWVGGSGTDKFMIWKAKRNNGVMEAESRVWAAIAFAPIMGVGLILYGVGAARGLPWIGPVFGMGMIGAGLAIAGEVSLGYTSESFAGNGEHGGMISEAITAMIVIRNIIACAMTFAIAPWIETQGLRDTFITCGFLGAAVMAAGGLCLVWGKKWRQSAFKSRSVGKV